MRIPTQWTRLLVKRQHHSQVHPGLCYPDTAFSALLWLSVGRVLGDYVPCQVWPTWAVGHLRRWRRYGCTRDVYPRLPRLALPITVRQVWVPCHWDERTLDSGPAQQTHPSLPSCSCASPVHAQLARIVATAVCGLGNVVVICYAAWQHHLRWLVCL